MPIRQACANDLDAACAVLTDCRLDLESRGLMQWDAKYPSRSFVRDAIANESLFVLSDDGRIAGVVVLDEAQAPEWSAVAWHIREPPFLVVHALAVGPHVQGRGCGREMLRFCEAMGRERGCTGVRLDVFSENAAALRFYEKQGYDRCGEVRFAYKPAGHQLYYCHEKSLARGGHTPLPSGSSSGVHDDRASG